MKNIRTYSVSTYISLSQTKAPNKGAWISARGPTNIVIFDGIMTAMCYGRIIQAAFVPFIKNVYPEGHKDNGPKHTSRYIQEDEGIVWWRTPPELPDCNPIENVWHELKIHAEGGETQKQGRTVNGIKMFWDTITVEKCQTLVI